MNNTETSIPSSIPPTGAAFERHYTPKELAVMWHMSEDAVRRLFVNEPGVLLIGHGEGLHRRRYVTMKIPESVVRRVHRRMTQGLKSVQ